MVILYTILCILPSIPFIFLWLYSWATTGYDRWTTEQYLELGLPRRGLGQGQGLTPIPDAGAHGELEPLH